MKNVRVYSFNFSFSSIKMLWVYYLFFLTIRRKIYIFIVIFDFDVEKSSLFYKQVIVACSHNQVRKMSIHFFVSCKMWKTGIDTLYTYKWPTYSIQIIIRHIIRWINCHDRNQLKSRIPVARTYPRGLRPWKCARSNKIKTVWSPNIRTGRHVAEEHSAGRGA